MGRVGWAIVGILYVAMLCGVTWGLLYARDVAAPHLDNAAGQKAWDDWRHDAAEQATGKGPVSRRVPKSAEPPLVLLMRDYFGVCVAGATLFASLLFAVLVFVVRGALFSTMRNPGGGLVTSRSRGGSTSHAER